MLRKATFIEPGKQIMVISTLDLYKVACFAVLVYLKCINVATIESNHFFQRKFYKMSIHYTLLLKFSYI